ncbi:MAG: hypothetical protein OEP95_16385 [Myxococcales bacterium]|nr:hypothetical protein [Myxococcales bacterium]
MLKCLSILAIAGLALALGGCSHMAGGIAPSNVPINGPYTIMGPAKGSDCLISLFGFLPVSGSNNTAGAVSRAQASVPGSNALVNLSVDVWTHYWILWTSRCTEVRATAVSLDTP